MDHKFILFKGLLNNHQKYKGDVQFGEQLFAFWVILYWQIRACHDANIIIRRKVLQIIDADEKIEPQGLDARGYRKTLIRQIFHSMPIQK